MRFLIYKCMSHGEDAFVGILLEVIGTEPAGGRSSRDVRESDFI